MTNGPPNLLTFVPVPQFTEPPRGETVFVGLTVPFRQGTLLDSAQLHLRDDQGTEPQAQVAVLNRWPDRSIRWCLLSFAWKRDRIYSIRCEDNVRDKQPVTSSQMQVDRQQKDAAELCWLSKPDGLGANFQIEVACGGTNYQAECVSFDPVASGPVRWSWRSDLHLDQQDDARWLQLSLWVTSHVESPVLTFELTIRNTKPADHPGGNWDLGAGGSVMIDDLSVNIGLPVTADSKAFKLLLSDRDEPVRSGQQLKIVQASSGGENWNGSNHVDRSRSVRLPFRGYRVNADGIEYEGDRTRPILTCQSGKTTFAVGRRDFWESFPSLLQAKANRLRIGLFPHEAGEATELQGGEQKTFQFAFAVGDHAGDGASGVVSAVADAIDPPIAHLDPIDYSKGEAWPYLMPRTERSDPRYEALVDLAIKGDDTFAIKGEKIDQFGWRNFGDLYGDHEAVDHVGDQPMVSHYNNQYDCTLGFAIQFMRTGDKRWHDLMTQMADHAWDIDTYHTTEDKLLYNGGLFWHTYHYADADTATHRSYPKRLRQNQSFDGGQDLSQLGETGEKLNQNYAIGGGPAASHNYSTGWMLAYYLTGTERYKVAAINAADYVLLIDDGRKTPFRFLCRSDTGYSTCSGEGYHGPGRAAANSTHALLTGHELTGESRYLDRAAMLMRRTVHPNQDLDALDLLNAELRWFYTMYLQALGRLVDYKVTLGQRDDDFRYGVATLLHYADWMERHERPTLSEPEKLQYPNETWAAQDMRKWHVLQHACLYQTDKEKRQAYQDKAEFFFDDVCETLSASPTKSLCRPVVLMMNFGWQRDWFLANPDRLHLDAPIQDDFGVFADFVPQRAIAIRRFKQLVFAGGAFAALILLAAIVWLLSMYFS